MKQMAAKRVKDVVVTGNPKKRFGCTLCGVTCSTKYGLAEHSRKHTGDKPFSCSECCQAFKRMTGLRKHQQFVHGAPGGRQYSCPECPVQSPVLGNIVRHVFVVHRVLRRFICSICAAKFSQNQELKVHLASKHQIKIENINSQEKKSINEIHVLPPYDLENRTVELIDKINKIVETEKNKLEGVEQLICSLKSKEVICKQPTTTNICDTDTEIEETVVSLPCLPVEEQLSEHETLTVEQNQQETEPPTSETWISFVLETTANESSEVLSNENSVHLDEIKENETIEIILLDTSNDTNVTNNDNVTNIVVTALRDEKYEEQEHVSNFTCEICNKTFTEKNRLTRHLKTHSDSKPHTCDRCGKGFFEHYNLVVHYRSHTGERPYLCPICGKEIRYHKDFVDHCLSHSQVKRFSCKYCGRNYTRKRDHDRHVLSHTNGNRFSCEVCGKGFTRRYLKDQHVLRHNEAQLNRPEKPVYECEICRKSYKTQQGFIHHKFKHTGLVDRQCPICTKTFLYDSKLQAHLRNHIPRVKSASCSKCQRMFTSDDTLKIHMDRYHKTELEDAIATIEETLIDNYKFSEVSENVIIDEISQTLPLIV